MHQHLRLLLFLASLGVSLHAAGQSGFRPGYVVPVAGDTLRGEVELRGAQQVARLCRFRTNSASAVTEYQPAQLRGYGATAGPRFETVPAKPGLPVFMEVLVSGKASLYTMYNDDDEQQFFMRSPQGAVLALQQRDTVKTAEPGARSAQVKERNYLFRPVLKQALADCLPAVITIPKVELKESQLRKLFVAYNNCGREAPAADVAPAASKAALGLLAGVYRATLPFGNNPRTTLKTGWNPTAGLALSFRPGRFGEKLMLRLEALYTQDTFEEEVTVPGSGINLLGTAQRRTDVKLNALQVPALIRYSLPGRRLRAFLQAGPQASIGFGGSAQQRRTEQMNGSAPSTTTTSYDVRTFRLGGAVGAGLTLKAGTGAVQVEVRRSFTDTPVEQKVAGGVQATHLLLGYQFR
ncbi:porin family protein [Hymenobacter weizhouensis]|uniref:porin family protein n=1 Tax=Hymenobacter sp. YIM 151500-1 TaxID=2987689 RepID=UPI00222772DC|nr:porin family protein [Hymenobacter sp. YIM 151500-1]UYZ63241.1 PorT family protein [Hymenobacter sp. YIM 151500-1]